MKYQKDIEQLENLAKRLNEEKPSEHVLAARQRCVTLKRSLNQVHEAEKSKSETIASVAKELETALKK